jgi:hypothetical protein
VRHHVPRDRKRRQHDASDRRPHGGEFGDEGEILFDRGCRVGNDDIDRPRAGAAYGVDIARANLELAAVAIRDALERRDERWVGTDRDDASCRHVCPVDT